MPVRELGAATIRKKSHFSRIPFWNPFVGGKVRKWEAPGEPKILQNHPKSVQGLAKVPLHGVLKATFTKRGDLHETSLFTMFEAHSAGPRSSLGYSFGPPSRPKGVPMPLLGRLGRSLKMNVFLEGSRCSLWLPKDSILGPLGFNVWRPFWYLFRGGTPKSLDTLKSAKSY